MPQIDSKALNTMLKNGELANIYYIYGTDIEGVEKMTKNIIKSAVDDNEDFALTKTDGKYVDFSSSKIQWA